jgi:iron-sulfur cluster repair protein YtfE (RIC family)
MSRHATAALREEHEHLLVHVEHLKAAAAELPELSIEERRTLLARVLEFLRGTLLPHAQAEERALYPAVAGLYGHPDATATMSYDHRAIGEQIDALAAADPADTDTVRQLLYGLYAVILVHFRKEEEVYLPLLEARPDAEVEALLAGLHEPEPRDAAER